MTTPIRILHFADAHIDMVTHGRHDEKTGLPLRVMDFLKSLDQIVEYALHENIDLVIFAGDAYRNQRPHPKYQKEWQKRILRLAHAGIPTVLVVGNHDTSPSSRTAHAMHEFETLQVPNVFVTSHPMLLSAEQLGINAQVVTLPWISVHALLRSDKFLESSSQDLNLELEERINNHINHLLEKADPDIPTILAGHATVAGAKWGSERQVLLGDDFVISHGLIRDKRLDYVALGHIHQHQELNKGEHPPAIYSGSIERVDFGEIKEIKGFVVAEVTKGKTTWDFIPLQTRKHYDKRIEISDRENMMESIMAELPPITYLKEAICRLQLVYPREWEDSLDEAQLNRHFEEAFRFQLVKRRIETSRTRIADSVEVDELSAEDLLHLYWQTKDVDADEASKLQAKARELFGSSFIA